MKKKRNLKDASRNKISFIEEKPLTFVKNYSLMFKKRKIITKKNTDREIIKNLIKLKKAKIITSIVKGNKSVIAISWDDKKVTIYLVVQLKILLIFRYGNNVEMY